MRVERERERERIKKIIKAGSAGKEVKIRKKKIPTARPTYRYI